MGINLFIKQMSICIDLASLTDLMRNFLKIDIFISFIKFEITGES